MPNLQMRFVLKGLHYTHDGVLLYDNHGQPMKASKYGSFSKLSEPIEDGWYYAWGGINSTPHGPFDSRIACLEDAKIKERELAPDQPTKRIMGHWFTPMSAQDYRDYPTTVENSWICRDTDDDATVLILQNDDEILEIRYEAWELRAIVAE